MLMAHFRTCLLLHTFWVPWGADPPNEAEMRVEEADVSRHLVVPLQECLWTCIAPSPSPPPSGVQEAEGALYRVKWVDSTQSYDLICDAPSELQ